jgi:hypothetical protein
VDDYMVKPIDFVKSFQAAKVLGFPWAWLLKAWSARIALTMRELGKIGGSG